MKTQLAAAVLAVLLAAPCAAGKYSAAEIKKMFQQSVDTEDLRLRAQLRAKIAEDSPDSAFGIASRTALLVMADRLAPGEIVLLYSKALELDPTIAVAYYNRAHAYLDLKQNEKALEGYQKAISLGFKKAMSYQGLADAQNALGQYEAAMGNYNKALEMDPNEAFTHNNRGNLYAKRGEYDKAIADFDAALKTSDFAMAHMNRADAYAGKKDYQKALADYKTAEEMIPDAPNVYARRSRLYLKLKEYRKAIADAETALGISPGNETALGSLAAASFYAGDYDKAEDAYKRYSRYFPKQTYPYDALSTVYVNKKRNDLALEAIKKAVELSPQRADLRERLARLKALSDDPKESEAGFTTLISTGTKNTEMYFLRGETRLETGDYKGAEADLNEVLKKNPGSSMATIDLALVYMRTGRRSEGLELFASTMDADPEVNKNIRKSVASNVSPRSKNTRAMAREMLKLYDADSAPAEPARANARPKESSGLTQEDCYCVVYTGQMPPYYVAKVDSRKQACEKIKFAVDKEKPGISGLKNCDEFKTGD